MSRKGFLPGALLAIIFLSCGLLACSTNDGGKTSVSPTATVQPAGATSPAGTALPTTAPVATQPPLTPTPTLPTNVQNCGTITVSLVGIPPTEGNKASDAAAGNCFWQNYQQCKSTMLNFRAAGVDTVTSHQFVATKIGNNCQVRDTVQHIIVPNRVMNSASYVCSGVNRDSTRLIFNSCGSEGNVAVPLNQTYNPQE